jgi:hypothetical protein
VLNDALDFVDQVVLVVQVQSAHHSSDVVRIPGKKSGTNIYFHGKYFRANCSAEFSLLHPCAYQGSAQLRFRVLAYGDKFECKTRNLLRTIKRN